MGRAYQGAFEAVIAIVVAGGLGAFADARLGTSPWLLILGVVLGFGAFVLRLVRMLEWMNQTGDAPMPPEEAGGAARRESERGER